MRLSRFSFRSSAAFIVLLLTLATASATKVNGTFTVPSGQTPQQAGSRIVGTVAGTPVYGYVDFRPTDPTGNTPQAMICGNITVIPHTIRGYIRGDGKLIDSLSSLGVDLTPTIGCQPTKTVDQARIFISRTSGGGIGSSPDLFWTEYKEIPSQPAIDWGTMPLAPPTAPVYQGYRQILISSGALPARTKLKVIGTASQCSDDSANDSTNCAFLGVAVAGLSLENPVITDSGKFQWKPNASVLLTRLSCNTDQGTVSVNFDLRTEASPNSTGLAVLSSPIVCSSTVTSATTTFSVSAVTSLSPVALNITTTSGTPTIVRVYLQYQLN